ncbi:MAG TPA: alpha/beta hydrolase [Sulfurovum sp.]|nr:alpha/beta hydrolase [Sulfurovum sp.]
MKSIFLYIISLLTFAYLGLGGYLYHYQNNFLYFPKTEITLKHTNMSMQNENESINIIVLNEGHENAILYFGGNAEYMAMSANYIARQFPKFTCYLMDYRGYGMSTGVATERGLYSDALKLYDTIKEKHNRISIGGRSLGSGIATYVASKRKVSKLALITPFDSIVSVAQDRYPMYPAKILLQDNQYDSMSRVEEISAETFIVMAENDKVIPRKNTQNLINAFKGKKVQVDIIKNRGHGDISSDDRYYKIMQDFIGEG